MKLFNAWSAKTGLPANEEVHFANVSGWQAQPLQATWSCCFPPSVAMQACLLATNLTYKANIASTNALLYMSLDVHLPAGCSFFAGQAYMAHRHLFLGVVSGSLASSVLRHIWEDSLLWSSPLDRLDCPFPGLSASHLGPGSALLVGRCWNRYSFGTNVGGILPGQTTGGYSSPAFGKLVAEEWCSLQDCLMSSADPASSKDATQLVAEVVDDFREIRPLTRIRGSVKDSVFIGLPAEEDAKAVVKAAGLCWRNSPANAGVRRGRAGGRRRGGD